jgi:KaiC/GvpD/RAD55 family RecA-like ATPase
MKEDPADFMGRVVKLQRQLESGTAERRPLGVVWADDIELELDKAGLVDGLLPRDGMTVIYGESGSGKTFITLDLVCHIAAGRPWRGMPVEQGVVVYVAAENPRSVERRIWAWKRRHGVEHLPVLVVRSSVDLLSGSTGDLVELVERVQATHGRIAAVAIDTLSRAMTGNENAPDDMGKFVDAVGRIGEAAETHAIVVHHCGKDAARGARGHSSLRAATDVELEVTADKATRLHSLRVSKNRDEEDGQVYGFRLEGHELGQNAAGRTLTTCVAVAAEPPPERAKAERKDRPLGPVEAVVLEVVQAALCDHGKPAEAAGAVARGIPRQATVVRRDRIDEHAAKHLAHSKGNKRREALERALTSLQGKRRLYHQDGWFWCPSQDVA